MLRLELVDGAGDPDAGGIHEHVEPPVLLAMLVDEAAAVRVLRDVGHDRVSPERPGGCVDLRLRPGGECQGEPVLAQHARDCEADTR